MAGARLDSPWRPFLGAGTVAALARRRRRSCFLLCSYYIRAHSGLAALLSPCTVVAPSIKPPHSSSARSYLSHKTVFNGHLKQEDLGFLPVSSEKSMFYGQPKQQAPLRNFSGMSRVRISFNSQSKCFTYVCGFAMSGSPVCMGHSSCLWLEHVRNRYVHASVMPL